MADSYASNPDAVTATCEVCGKRLTVTKAGTLRTHSHPARRCAGSGQVPASWTRETRTGGPDNG